nr:unnamed protein product [Spirometra erinaceieuropaei]
MSMELIPMGLINFLTLIASRRYVPRSIFIDSEPSVTDEVQNGLFRSLFNPCSFIHGKEEAANNYARGRFILGAQIMEPIVERVRKEVESTDMCQGFVVNHSTGGGTGSGVTVRVMEHLADTFHKAANVQIPIYPSEYLSTAVVDPYNALLHSGFNIPYRQEPSAGPLVQSTKIFLEVGLIGSILDDFPDFYVVRKHGTITVQPIYTIIDEQEKEGWSERRALWDPTLYECAP